jgi:hypothetical protein
VSQGVQELRSACLRVVCACPGKLLSTALLRGRKGSAVEGRVSTGRRSMKFRGTLSLAGGQVLQLEGLNNPSAG